MEHRRIGMGAAQLHRVDRKGHALFLCQRKAVRQAGIIRAQAQQARHQRPVGAVALAGGGKAAVQADVRLCRHLAQQLLGRVGDPRGTGGMAGGRPDHHRAQNVEKSHDIYILSLSRRGRAGQKYRNGIFYDFYYTSFRYLVL